MKNSNKSTRKKPEKSWAYLYERALQEASVRAIFLLLVFIALIVVVISRVAWLQLVNDEFYISEGEKRYLRVEQIRGKRGIITDSRGEPLAKSEVFAMIEVSPQRYKKIISRAKPDKIKKINKYINQLARYLDKPESKVNNSLTSNRGYLVLAKDLQPQIASAKIKGIPGLSVKTYNKRLYPTAEVNARLIGLTDSNDRGLEGLEKFYDLLLQDKSGTVRKIRDNSNNVLDSEIINQAHNGEKLELSIDNRIQQYAYTVLRNSVIDTKAKEAALVMIDTLTGEVLAMVGYPSFNPNNRASLDRRYIRNNVVNDIFEPGSSIKPFFAALAIEKGVASTDDIYDVSKRMVVSGKDIVDVSRHKKITLSEVIQYSSNRGIVQATEKLTNKESWEMLSKLGFGEVLPISLPGSVPGVLRNYSQWYPLDKATIAFGHTMSASLLQLVRAYSVFTRGGEVIQPTLLKSESRAVGRRVFSEHATAQVVKMLEAAVSNGSGKKAKISGYKVAGKTGTAKKFIGGRYANKYIATFVGFAPADNPKLLMAVMINEPSKDNDRYYGGSVASPAFAKVMSQALRLKDIKSDIVGKQNFVQSAY